MQVVAACLPYYTVDEREIILSLNGFQQFPVGGHQHGVEAEACHARHHLVDVGHTRGCRVRQLAAEDEEIAAGQKRNGDALDQFLPLRKLVGQPLYIPSRRSRLDSIRAWFEELGEEPTIAGDLSHYIDAVALAEQNAGICIDPMTTYNVSDLIVTKIITESARQVEYALVWNKNQHNSELTAEFINYVQDCLDEEKNQRQKYRMPERAIREIKYMDVPELMKKLSRRPASQGDESKKEDETSGNTALWVQAQQKGK